MLTNEEKALKLVQKAGILRPRELAAVGIPRTALCRLEQAGKVRRVGRGLYAAAEADTTEHIDIMEVCKRVPQGVVCLISALSFHGMTTQIPHEVWLAVGIKSHKPRIDYPPVRVVRFSKATLEFGVETHVIDGVTVRVTSPPKTVADCFKYRNRVGMDVAIEALKDCWQERKGRVDHLWEAAKVCRVKNVMRPFLEAIVYLRAGRKNVAASAAKCSGIKQCSFGARNECRLVYSGPPQFASASLRSGGHNPHLRDDR